MIESFKDAMRQAGIDPPGDVVADGNLHRFHVTGDRTRSENGWYVLHSDPAAGAFGCWKRDINETWSGREYQTLTPEEKARHRANLEAQKRQREAEQEQRRAECRKKANAIWSKATPAPADHPYLIKKNVKPYGLKVYKEALVVPVRSANQELVGLQFISPHGSKTFLTGTDKKGGYHSIGGRPESVLYLAEGYATAATIHEATGQAVAVCFDCGNLKPVALAMRSELPEAQIIICADNDRHTDNNPGLTKGTEAAQAVGGLLAVPDFPSGAEGTDFNDLTAAVGLDEVKRQILAARTPETLAELAGLAEPLPLRRPLPPAEQFPLEALPHVLRDMADLIIDVVQAPAAMVAQSLLIGSTLAAQSLADVTIDGRQFPLSLFAVSIGESGERKSATDNIVLAPHRKHERALMDQAKQEQLEFIAAHAAWTKAKDQILKSKEGDTRRELMALDPEPLPPIKGLINVNYFSGSATIKIPVS
ncbi:DUF3987 domain-containing protein [Geoalkalibacter subterraneus]|uniref:DUF3987 domain-containing protein n=1 Tax=Geoalkalibacter subterraneus TaxID=483547 RepID=UPI000694B1A0|nr:DUF3987 domain-containing protein [Geoalkalibacter subterraneus]